MKNFALFLIIITSFAGCKSVQSQQSLNTSNQKKTNSKKDEVDPIPIGSPKNLTEAQKRQLDEKIPTQVREILDKAHEIYIYYNIDRATNQLRTLNFKTVPNAGAKLSDASLKKQFLESFYFDASTKESGAMCFSPRHKVTAKYSGNTVELDICYQCSNFQGKSSAGNFGGGLAYKDKSSLSLINEIIRKYGTEIE